MVVRTLDVEKDPFRPPNGDEEILGPEEPYLWAIRALLFLASHTRPDISFLFNLLARYSSCPTRRHWNGVKQIFRYLQDSGYMSDPHTGRSQTGYVFTSSNTAISWRSVKQTMSATSSNHVEILAINEASEEASTVVHEDNATCIAQLKDRYIKGDRIKHNLPKFFFTHNLQKSGDIVVQKVRSSDNLADSFTKALSTATFKKLVHGIGMQRLNELKRITSPTPKIVSEVLQYEKPSFFVCNSDNLYQDQDIPSLDSEDELDAGQIYFILPKSMLARGLSASDMASLAVKASLALDSNTNSNSHVKKKKNNNARIFAL
ncbi:secreted RxLR effector protein 161-like protein [Tanacetum coccineum]|uniref:Secreted RxLR effector protein 161-like protein n=1 Tax=Tanacetum coccineum TaxID=301880 RepID=A0ABQ5H458_9ASTR